VKIPSEQGRYHDYYAAFGRAVRDGAPLPVTAEQGIAVLAVLDAARRSALEGRTVEMA
ncbi:gfo/Idh/MocA family oxidoreductase, partial [Thioclava sp. BHET1]